MWGRTGLPCSHPGRTSRMKHKWLPRNRRSARSLGRARWHDSDDSHIGQHSTSRGPVSSSADLTLLAVARAETSRCRAACPPRHFSCQQVHRHHDPRRRFRTRIAAIPSLQSHRSSGRLISRRVVRSACANESTAGVTPLLEPAVVVVLRSPTDGEPRRVGETAPPVDASHRSRRYTRSATPDGAPYVAEGVAMGQVLTCPAIESWGGLRGLRVTGTRAPARSRGAGTSV